MNTDWREVWALYAAGLTAACQLGKVAVAAVQVGGDLGLSLTELGWAMSLVNLLGVALGTLAGAWADRIGGRRALLAGLAAMAAAGLAQAFAANGTALLAARTVEGVGYLVVVVTAPTLIARRAAPADLPLALALWGTFVPAGLALVALLAGVLAEPLGWRGLFALDALLPVAAAVAVLAVVAPAAPLATPRAGLAIYRAPGPVWAALAFCCFTACFQGFLGFLPTRLVADKGLALPDAALVTGLAAATAALGTLAAGGLMKRGVGAPTIGTAGLLVPALASAAVFGAGGSGAAVAGAFVFMAVGGLVPAAVFAGLPRLAGPALIGPANGLVVQTGNLGSLIGPPLVASWAGPLGWSWTPLLMVAVSLAGAAMLIVAYGRRGAAEAA